MAAIEFQVGGDVSVSDSDGAYLEVREDFAQVVIIGPMRWSPLAYEAALREEIGEEFEICAATFLGTDDLVPPLKLVALRRGIVALRFQKRGRHAGKTDSQS